jgi:hypothetical protein
VAKGLCVAGTLCFCVTRLEISKGFLVAESVPSNGKFAPQAVEVASQTVTIGVRQVNEGEGQSAAETVEDILPALAP